MVNTFPKNRNKVYRILDDDAYERFWWGRRPSTRRIYEEWLLNKNETMRSVARRNNKNGANLLERLNMELRKQGIMDVISVEEAKKFGYVIADAIVGKALYEVLLEERK